MKNVQNQFKFHPIAVDQTHWQLLLLCTDLHLTAKKNKFSLHALSVKKHELPMFFQTEG